MLEPATILPGPTRTMPRPLAFLCRMLTEMFAIDVRALAAFRIAMGLLLLVNLGCRLVDLDAHYTDHGVMPRQARLAIYQWRGMEDTGRYPWSLHLLNGSAWSQEVLFAVSAVFAVWLLLGYRTRLSTCASWLLLISLGGRNPMIVDGGEAIWEAMLFWSMFVPLGAAWSIDRRLRPPLTPPPQRILSCATAALLVQVAMMYFFNGLFKTAPMWDRDFTAVYYVMNLSMYATHFGESLRQFPGLLKVLTAGTFFLELCGSLLAFVPLWKGLFRRLAIVGFTLLHLGFVLTMTLGIFPWICIACWLLFWPQSWWDRLSRVRLFGRLAARLERRAAPYLNAVWFRNPERPRLRSSRLASTLVVLLGGIVLLWNVRELQRQRKIDRDAALAATENGPTQKRSEAEQGEILPDSFDLFMRGLGFDQRWCLFAPQVFNEEGYFTMEGTLAGGQIVNLWRPGLNLPATRAEAVEQAYVNQRWRNYLMALAMPENAFQKTYLSDWLRWRWEQQLHPNEPTQKIIKVRIILHVEKSPEPGQPRGEPAETIWVWRDPFVPDPTIQDIPPPVLPSDTDTTVPEPVK
ncbi:MAG TPA: HTTM domain-containing protein [Pirellulales bacterium]|jgi:hypothetical protein|nr:HTTM domain-containing protein [Pirellulales bacterium]